MLEAGDLIFVGGACFVDLSNLLFSCDLFGL